MLKITPKITIAGAGSIGCFVGGLLIAARHDVTFLGRKHIGLQLEQHGLILTDYSGMDVSVEPDSIRFSEDPNVLADADIIAVCVKSSATEEIARLVREHARNDVVIISLQNGLRNADILKEALSEFDVRAGMVPFNVVQAEESRFHRGTSGDIVIEAGTPDISAILKTENLPFHASDDIKSVQWGKLLFNLNNGLNALSDLPLVEQLSDATLRRQFADVMSEALGVMKVAGIHPTPPTAVPAKLLPHILRLPTPVFRLIAKQMLAMDPQARASMWQDLQQGRKTEIDDLQGEIIALGEKHGIATPNNAEVMQKIRSRETST